ncbi:granulocyte colony-stimulating factor receptor-like [Symphorus nematophorus]
MATLKTRWLLSILLVHLPNSFALAGPPARPSPPDCYIPCDENNCRLDIHCTLPPGQEPQVSTIYSLHWRPAYSEEGHVINGTSLNGRIHRQHFTNNDELHVWVQAKNEYGSAKSEEVKFNTADIIKPSPPKIIYEEPLEIHAVSICDKHKFSMGPCDVRHRTEADQAWLEGEGEFYATYMFDSLQPCTAYKFQVRCACDPGLMSDWTETHRINATEQTPVGQLDVWRDCGISSASFDCVLIWKKLPVSQACGLILGYEVRLSYSNGPAALVNLSTVEPADQLVCDETQCHFNSSLKDVSSVSVSAYNAHGSTVPSYLAMPVPGKGKNEQAFHLKMTEENLSVSWDLPSQLPDSLKEYVVQYKQAGRPPGQAFDWIKVNKSHTSAFLKGQFKNYTPYQVSLFTVSHSSELHLLSSVIGYSLEGTPSKVPKFEVFSISATHVTLLWEPVPLLKQNGMILYYQIGVDRQKVYNVTVSSQHGNKTFVLQHLSPGHDHEVWIRAVTAAGPGENATTRFKTRPRQDFVYFVVVSVICCLFIVCAVLVYVSVCRGENKSCPLVPQGYCDRVPDPRNSRIFREMKHQINEPMTWICIPISEPHPKISLLEVLETQPRARKSSSEESADTDGLIGPVVKEGSSQMECRDVTEEVRRPDHKYGREAYSKMVDSDEERDKEEEEEEEVAAAVEEEEDTGGCWSSSEEEQCPSGYEKHFMPTALEILEVS